MLNKHDLIQFIEAVNCMYRSICDSSYKYMGVKASFALTKS